MSAPYPLGPEAEAVPPAVARLHQLLSERVARLSGLPGAEYAGRLNLRPSGDGPGPADDPARAEKLRQDAVAHCRVLVPLYCEEYFRNLRCGREWKVFAQRFESAAARPAAPPIVPVLWRPVPEVVLPEVARRLEFDHSAIGQDYSSAGMLALSRSPFRQAEYRQAVGRLAAAVVACARSVPADAGAGVVELARAESAFDESGLVRLLVAAEPDGPSARSWGLRTPRDREPEGSLIRLVRDILESQGYTSVVETFDVPDGSVVRPGPLECPPPHPGAVTVLLLDPWALDRPRLAELVRTFVARETGGPLAVLVPWTRGEEDARAEERRRESVFRALEPFLSRRVPQLRSLPIVVTDPEMFRQTLAQELRSAAEQLEYSSRGRRPDTSGTAGESSYEPGYETPDSLPPPRLLGPDSGPLSRW